jgi:GTP-binding protein LepA
MGYCRVGDTITLTEKPAEQLPGYKEIKPMVYAGIFPVEGDDFEALRKAMERLQLSDSALVFEAEHSQALGFGFRAGFLGLLHLEIVQERLEREHGMNITVTVPSVAYTVKKSDGSTVTIKSPEEWPEPSHIEHSEEPWVNVDIITPETYLGSIMGLVIDYRGRYKTTEYIQSGKERRAILHYEMPLASILVDFYDKLKSASQGYASLNYELIGYERAEIVKMDIHVAEEPVEALAMLVWKEHAIKEGKRIVEILKKTLTRQQFVLKIQAMIGGKIIAAERLSALRKDVTAKLYGGDVSRKRKLLEKQKKGKKRMLAQGTGKVEIPSKAYLAVLKR